MPATSRDRRAALAVVAVSSVLFACLVPFATVPLTPVPAFVASYQSVLALNDLITAILLYSQFGLLRSRALLLLASGYLFTAVAAIVHLLTFPGVFAPAGLLGAGPQTTAWLYVVWHGGFPLLVLGYALLKERDGGAKIRGSVDGSILGSVIAVGFTMSVMTWVATARHDILPIIVSGGHFNSALVGVESVVGFLILAAPLFVLWFRRPHSVIDIWLMVVLCAWLFDIALSGILNGGRFDLGFYAGRFYGAFAASFVLVVLLINNVALQAQLANLLASLRRQSASERERHSERERLFSAVVESSNDAIITQALDDTITGWNRAAERLFGFSAAEAVGRRIDIIVPPDRRAEVQNILDRVGRGEAVEHHETLRLQGRQASACGAFRLADPVGGGFDRRRVRDRTRYHRNHEDAKGAPSGDRGAAAHLRDLAGSHPGDGHQGQFRSGLAEFDDDPRLPARRNDRAQCGRVHPPRRSRLDSRGNARGAARPQDAQIRDPLRP